VRSGFGRDAADRSVGTGRSRFPVRW